ncbi:MAG: hypothetical protein WDA11_12655 [Thiohalomonadaceae bacterium]
MSDPKTRPEDTRKEREKRTAHEPKLRVDLSIPEWGDPVCSCEAEPYWLEVAEDLDEQSEAVEHDAPAPAPAKPE